MAPRRTASKETAPVSTFDFDAVEPVLADKPVINFKYNPLKRWIQASIDQGYAALELTVPTEVAKDAVNMLRRAVLPEDKGGLDVGLRLVSTDQADGNTLIAFQTKAVKKSRSYTTADVRAWAADRYPKEDIYPRVKREVSRDYRIAHGLEAPASE
jgi:hypothetical protein